MESSDLRQLVRRRWRTMVAVILACLAFGVVINARSAVTYRSSAQIFVSLNLATRDPSALSSANLFATARVQSYVAVASSPPVTGPVVAELHLQQTPTALGKEISATAPANQVLINISVTDGSAVRAAAICNAVAEQFRRVVNGLESTGGTAPLKLTVIRPARVSSAPISPRTRLNLFVATVIGLLLALGAARYRERIDDGPRSVKEVEDIAGAPVIAVIGRSRRFIGPMRSRRRIDGDERAPVFRGSERPGSSGVGPALTRLWDNVRFLDARSPFRTLAITSAQPGEGKTFIALRLAAAVAAAQRTVVLVDANLRAPGVAEALGINSSPGLSELVFDERELPRLLQTVEPRMQAIAAGPIPPDPTAILRSDVVIKALAAVATDVSYTILDCAAVSTHSDGLSGAALADMTILVTRARTTGRRVLADAISRLDAAGAHPAAVVLSGASRKQVEAFLGGTAQRPAMVRGGASRAARGVETTGSPR